MLGSTQTVDMETTRRNNFGHILVAVLDPKLLPRKLDVVIGDHYFELKFEIEPVGFDDNGEEVHFNFDDRNNDGNHPMEEDNSSDECGLDREGKRSKKDRSAVQGQKEAPPNNGESAVNEAKDVSSKTEEQREEMERKIRKMANKIMDMDVDMTLDYCVDKVLAEEETDQGDGRNDVEVYDDEDDFLDRDSLPQSDLAASDSVVVEVEATPRRVLEVAGVGELDRTSRESERSGSGWPTCRSAGSAPPRLRNEHSLVSPGVGFTWCRLADHIKAAAAGIMETTLSPTRASPRLAKVVDQHVMEKAKKRAAWRNLDIEGTDMSLHSFFAHVIF